MVVLVCLLITLDEVRLGYIEYWVMQPQAFLYIDFKCNPYRMTENLK